MDTCPRSTEVKWPEWKVHGCALALTFCPPVYCARGPYKYHVCMMSAVGSRSQDGSGRVQQWKQKLSCDFCYFLQLKDDRSYSGGKQTCVASFCINV